MPTGKEKSLVSTSSSEDGAGWLAFLRSLVARGLSGVALVISDAHAGLIEAIGATLPGAVHMEQNDEWTGPAATWESKSSPKPEPCRQRQPTRR